VSFRGAPLGASPESITTMPTMAYYVYILASTKYGTLYLGVTNDIALNRYRGSRPQERFARIIPIDPSP
jgi:hypothetical protein